MEIFFSLKLEFAPSWTILNQPWSWKSAVCLYFFDVIVREKSFFSSQTTHPPACILWKNKEEFSWFSAQHYMLRKNYQLEMQGVSTWNARCVNLKCKVCQLDMQGVSTEKRP